MGRVHNIKDVVHIVAMSVIGGQRVWIGVCVGGDEVQGEDVWDEGVREAACEGD